MIYKETELTPEILETLIDDEQYLITINDGKKCHFQFNKMNNTFVNYRGHLYYEDSIKSILLPVTTLSMNEIEDKAHNYINETKTKTDKQEGGKQ
ncbi:MAG: hypothetical protein AABY22_04030 [Nanoarchaeota archaeon]